MIRVYLVLKLLVVFTYEVVKANIDVALWVVRSNDKLTPAFLEVPLELKNEWALVSLAQMITLTPGTLSLEFSSDRKILFVHVLHTDSPRDTVISIKQIFEEPLLRIFGEKRSV